MPFDVEKKDSGNIEVIDLPDDYTGNPETGSGPGKGGTPETGEGPGKGGSPGTGDDPGKGDTPEKDGSPDSGGGFFPWLGDQLSKFVDNATNAANDLWKWGKEKAGELGEQVAQAAEETWEWVKENKEFVAVTAVGVTLTVAGVFFPPLLPLGVSILAGEALSGGVSYAFGTRGKDLCKEMAIGGALSVVGMGVGVGALAAKAGRSIVSKVLTSRPIAAMAAAVKNSRAAVWLASGARLAARPFQAAAARWLQRSRLGAALVSAGRGVTRQAASFANAIRNSTAGRAADRLGSQAARSIQTALSRVAVPIYRQSRGSEAAAGVSASIAEDKMRGKDISWTKAVLSGSLAALLVFGGSVAQKQVNQTAVNADTTVAAVQTTVERAGNPHLERAVAGDNVGVMLSSKVEVKNTNTWNEFQKAHKGQFASSKVAAEAYRKLLIEQSPWPIGYSPQQSVLKPGTRFRMALSPGQPATRPGGFGTFDHIRDVEYVRNNLAVKQAWKPEVDRVITYEVVNDLPVALGPVGPQIDQVTKRYLPGGGSQLEMNVTPAERMKYLKIVEEREIR